ncbi:iron-siderophore ABC transporter substrate-binding protein [Pseudomonas sp. SG20056]|uniref:iron-siderophore ABC transporter substrate-binding protein n=1 Tax=Pseudomonas sp. SG20056 TaxID=3074146 RepID=UPI00287FE6ED|nr:iron-siderophore ABC transporter substrate-binding protein [Pseudomonas sp. SG20056]WNF45240.1 iron-siderophore ABC transporter substrate-binding protein [Pseudomonas sp. SG20056]
MTTLLRWSLPLLLATQLLSAAAVADTRQVEDAFGNPVTVPSSPQRVITLSELDLDAALALGITPVGTINGRGQAAPPRYLDSKALAGIKVVGDIDNPNLETLLELEPDLILTGPVKPEQLAILNEIAPTVITFAWAKPWQESLQRTANALNQSAAADVLLARYNARAAEARERLKAHQGETFSIVRWNPKGPSYMFKDAFASSVISDVGLIRPSYQQDPGHTHSMALSLESLQLLDADWLVIGTLSTSGEAVEALQQAEQTPAFKQLSAIQGKRFGAVDGSLWTSLGGPQAALQVIADIEQLLGKADAQPFKN